MCIKVSICNVQLCNVFIETYDDDNIEMYSPCYLSRVFKSVWYVTISRLPSLHLTMRYYLILPTLLLMSIKFILLSEIAFGRNFFTTMNSNMYVSFIKNEYVLCDIQLGRAITIR